MDATVIVAALFAVAVVLSIVEGVRGGSLIAFAVACLAAGHLVWLWAGPARLH